jgi:endo-1,4-beta-D-glucanase Y
LIHIKTERKDPMVIINNAELADVWGAINLKYAKKLYKDETGEEFSGSISVCKEYLRRLLSQFRISGSK